MDKIESFGAAPPIDQDFIVHNMPAAARRTLNTPVVVSDVSRESSGFVPTAKKHNFKLVGLVIIVGGFVLVSGFVYLSYQFIVKPKTVPPVANTATTSSEKTVPQETEVATTSNDIEPVTPPAELTTTTPEVVASATSTGLNPDPGDEPARINTDNLLPVVDTDSDGLFDDEEAVFGTLTTNVDSDADGFNDLTEIQKGYDPAGSAKLSANLYLAKYSNATYQYELLTPKNWPSQSLNSEATVIFTAPDESLIQISVQDNFDQASILNWYSQSFPDSLVTYDKLKNTDYYDGVMGEGGLNFYLTDKNRRQILVISYIPAINNRLAYPNVFRLIIDSLVIK